MKQCKTFERRNARHTVVACVRVCMVKFGTLNAGRQGLKLHICDAVAACSNNVNDSSFLFWCWSFVALLVDETHYMSQHIARSDLHFLAKKNHPTCLVNHCKPKQLRISTFKKRPYIHTLRPPTATSTTYDSGLQVLSFCLRPSKTCCNKVSII